MMPTHFGTKDVIWWQQCVGFSWAVWFIEFYIYLREYHICSKLKPPVAISCNSKAEHSPKSHALGKDSARLSLVLALYKQCMGSAVIYLDIYKCFWSVAVNLLAWFGYGVEHELFLFVVFAIIVTFVSIFLSLLHFFYQRFTLEAKYRLNKAMPAPFLFSGLLKWAGSRFMVWLVVLLIASQMSMGVVICSITCLITFVNLSRRPHDDSSITTDGIASKRIVLKSLHETFGSKYIYNIYVFGLPSVYHALHEKCTAEEFDDMFFHPHELQLFSVLPLFLAFIFTHSIDFPKDILPQIPTVIALLLFQIDLTIFKPFMGLSVNIIFRRLTLSDLPIGQDVISSGDLSSEITVPEMRSQGVQTPCTTSDTEQTEDDIFYFPPRKRPRNSPPFKLPLTGIELEISQSEVIYECGLRKVFKLRSGKLLKCGGLVQPEEAESMKFVAQRTTVPIPGSVEFIREHGKRYLLMDYVDGQPLGKVWTNLEDVQKTTILAELKSYMNQLRALEGSYIGSLHDGPCRDRRVVNWPIGPFTSERLFNDHIVANLRTAIPAEHVHFLRKLLNDYHKVVFTHGDLHPNNILIKDGRIVAILDWEMSGWYPEYWEYCKALWNVQWDSDWQNHVCEFLDPYRYEYAVDQCLLHNSQSAW